MIVIFLLNRHAVAESKGGHHSQFGCPSLRPEDGQEISRALATVYGAQFGGGHPPSQVGTAHTIFFFLVLLHNNNNETRRDGRLDLLIGDTPILDYYRANDPGCTLRTVDVIEEDNYAVGMTKGLRLQVKTNLHSNLFL